MKINHHKRLANSVGQNEDFELLPEDRIIEIFSISRRILRDWRNNRKLPYYKIGRNIWYGREDISAFISRYRVAPPVTGTS